MWVGGWVGGSGTGAQAATPPPPQVMVSRGLRGTQTRHPPHPHVIQLLERSTGARLVGGPGASPVRRGGGVRSRMRPFCVAGPRPGGAPALELQDVRPHAQRRQQRQGRGARAPRADDRVRAAPQRRRQPEGRARPLVQPLLQQRQRGVGGGPGPRVRRVPPPVVPADLKRAERPPRLPLEPRAASVLTAFCVFLTTVVQRTELLFNRRPLSCNLQPLPILL